MAHGRDYDCRAARRQRRAGQRPRAPTLGALVTRLWSFAGDDDASPWFLRAQVNFVFPK